MNSFLVLQSSYILAMISTQSRCYLQTFLCLSQFQSFYHLDIHFLFIVIVACHWIMRCNCILLTTEFWLRIDHKHYGRTSSRCTLTEKSEPLGAYLQEGLLGCGLRTIRNTSLPSLWPRFNIHPCLQYFPIGYLLVASFFACWLLAITAWGI